MMLDNFALFILSHGRSDRMYTLKALENSNYTGDWYIIIDDQDKTADRYYELFGERVIMFDKEAAAEITEEGNNFNDRHAIVFARNASFQIAEQLEIEYFMQIEDDYTSFDYRFDNNFMYVHKLIRNLDAIIEIMLDYYKSIPAMSVAMLQGGDMLGGESGQYSKSIRTYRKAMNTLICSTKRPFKFFGIMNDDVCAYTRFQNLGHLFLSINNVTLEQTTTQKQKDGNAVLYLKYGTYVKSFYSVMFQPSSVTVQMMHSRHPRLHHHIEWKNTVPCIISEKYRKASASTLLSNGEQHA